MIDENSLLNGRYQLERKIGQGGFAQVFLATDCLLKRAVAVKVMNSDLAAEPDFLRRFEQEAQSVAMLEHANILGVYDFGRVENTAYLIMPYIKGGTLQDRVNTENLLSLHQINYYLQQAAAALDYAHHHNIIHRDIKPQNILLRAEDDRVLLTDFGIAKVLSTNNTQSRTKTMGTLAYMAPEQFEGMVGPGVDVYALGCVLFQLLTGELPFNGSTKQIMLGHFFNPVPSVAGYNRRQIPGGIQKVLEKALAKLPEDRFPAAGELAKAYQEVINGRPGLEDAPINTVSAAENLLISTTVSLTETIPLLSESFNNKKDIEPFPKSYPGPLFSRTRLAKRSKQVVQSRITIPAVIAVIGFILFFISGSIEPSKNIVEDKKIGTQAGILDRPNKATPNRTGATAGTDQFDPVTPALEEAYNLFYVNGNYSAGLNKYLILTLDYPKNSKVWRDYGQAVRGWTNDISGGGVEALEKAAQLNPKDALTFLYLTDAYIYSYRYDDALKAAKQAAQADSNSWIGHAAFFLAYSSIHKAGEAKKEAETMQSLAGDAESDPYYNVILARYLSFQEHDFKAGLAAIEKTARLWPKVPSVMLAQASMILNSASARQKSMDERKQSQEKALALLQNAEQLAPRSSNILTTLGAYFVIFLEDGERADKYVQQSLSVYEGNAETHRIAALIGINKKNYDNAGQEFQRCTEIDKYNLNCYADWSAALILKGDDLFRANQKSEAISSWKLAVDKIKSAVEGDPRSDPYLFQLGLAYSRLGDNKNSIEALQQAVNLAPNNAAYYGWLGLAYLSDGQKEKAQASYNNGNFIDPENQFIKALGEQLKQ